MTFVESLPPNAKSRLVLPESDGSSPDRPRRQRTSPRTLEVTLGVDRTTGTAPLTVTFNAAVAENGGFGRAPYRFDLITYSNAIAATYEEFSETSNSPSWTPSIEFMIPGTYFVYAYVTDRDTSKGASRPQTITVTPRIPRLPRH